MKEAFQGRGRPTMAWLTAALALRLMFAFLFPHTGGDSPIYETFARNLLHHHVYSHIPAEGTAPPPPTLIRSPGYPLFLAAIFSVAGDSNETAVRIVQAFLDTFSAALIAVIVFRLARGKREQRQGAAQFGLALAALCPFVGNYAASILSEVPATFLFVLAVLAAIKALQSDSPGRNWFWCGVATGAATLFRPETGLWLVVPGAIVLWRTRKGGTTESAEVLRPGTALCAIVLMFVGLVIPLLPWTARNLVSLKTFQPLSPFYAEDPNEFVPRGYMKWCRTWLWRFRELDAYIWPVDGQPVSFEGLPPGAVEGADQAQRVSELFKRYNEQLTMTPDLDTQFGQLARERVHAHPVRFFVTLPMLRGVALWFTPRREILPLEGKLWPVAEAFEDDPRDFSFTALLFFVNLGYLVLALRGGVRLWSAGSTGFLLVAGSIVLRTVFFAFFTFPEPRYTLEVYPLLIVLASFAGGSD
ncbi:MAG: glycosyltransferase family 39 protein [Acidobacteriia bacterium]|nr:glycosyltransferase family 39 protein [Terriglobia bacterium]